MSCVFSPFDDVLESRNEYINRYAANAEKEIRNTEKSFEKVLSTNSMNYEKYKFYFYNLERLTKHATANLNRYSEENKEELLRKTMEYLDNLIEKNEHTRKTSEESIIKLNQKYFETITLAKICAKVIESHGIENYDLTPPIREVYESICDKK